MNNQTEFVETMLTHYVICALWSSNDESTPEGGEPMDKNYGPDDIAPDAMEKARNDCASFVQKNTVLLADMDAEQAGHDFWLTRNGHGAGFWDRDLGARGDALTKACKEFGEVNAIVGDDNKIYFE